MNSNNHLRRFAQSAHTTRTKGKNLLPPESRFRTTTYPSGLSTHAQNGLKGLKSGFVAQTQTDQFEGDLAARKSAQNPRTARAPDKSLLPPESGFGLAPQPSGLSARTQNGLEDLLSNLVAPYRPFDATYHSMGWEGPTSPAQIARGISVSPESGSRLTNRICFARRRVATTLPDITMKS